MLELIRELDERHFTGTRVQIMVLAKCSNCGEEITIAKQNYTKSMKRGSQYCRECIDSRAHGMTHTRIWEIWSGMKKRAKGTGSQKDRRLYEQINMCERWECFENFYADMSPTYAEHLTIERIDNKGPYSPENCRWASQLEQQANKRTSRYLTYQGEQLHLAELCRRSGISKSKLSPYLKGGSDGDAAVAAAQSSTYNKGAPRKSRSMTL